MWKRFAELHSLDDKIVHCQMRLSDSWDLRWWKNPSWLKWAAHSITSIGKSHWKFVHERIVICGECQNTIFNMLLCRLAQFLFICCHDVVSTTNRIRPTFAWQKVFFQMRFCSFNHSLAASSEVLRVGYCIDLPGCLLDWSLRKYSPRFRLFRLPDSPEFPSHSRADHCPVCWYHSFIFLRCEQ
jgi:hypothetical protein